MSESRKTVAITLHQRSIFGTYPDGSSNIDTLDLVYSSIEIGLHAPLGARRLIDGSSGEQATPLCSDADSAPYQDAIADGCPRWIP